MKKRGQVTIFIILAIVLILIVASYFIFKDKINNTFNAKDFPDVEKFIQNCADSSAEQAIIESAKKGGIYAPQFVTYEGAVYYKYQNNWYFPAKEELENNLALEFESLFLNCINEFSNFTNYQISTHEIKISSDIERNFVRFDINYLVTVAFGEKSANFEYFSSKININYLKLYSAVAEYIETQKNNSAICLTCLSNILQDYKLKAEVFDSLDKTASIYVFSSEEIKLNNEKITFVFANEN